VVHASIMLGSSTYQAVNIYGLAYNITISPLAVKPGTLAFNYTNGSFLGTKNTNALTITRLNNDVETAIVGTDHADKSGYGKIGDLYFTLADNLQVTLSISNYEAIDAKGNQLTFSLGTGTVNVVTGVNQLSATNNQISIYPNPSGGEVTIVSTKNIDELKVFNLLGQLVYESQPKQIQFTFELKDDGMYIVTVTAGNEITTGKVVVN
jgi:hypothetical protein